MARILIVDDSAVTRNSLRGIVTALGHTVVGEATNGAQAFVEYTKLKPDLVTMDLTMGGMGGAEATSKIISVYPEARIIVISATEARQGVIDALERGARHFIIKPIRQEKVAVVLQNVLQQDYNLQKHRERVRQLKKAQKDSALLENEGKQILPPYAIHSQEGHLVYVLLNETLTLNSCQSLVLELEEHLSGKPLVLFDFGTTSKLDQPVLDKLNELIQSIISHSGRVKAIANNRSFFDAVTKDYHGSQTNVLADVIGYFDK